MRKPHLHTVLLLVLALFLSACDTLNGLLPKTPEPEERLELEYGLSLLCYSGNYIHPDRTYWNDQSLGVGLRYAVADPNIEPPQDYRIPITVTDTRTGMLAHEQRGFLHIPELDRTLPDSAGTIYTDKPATPGRDYRINFDGNTHTLTLPEDACIPPIQNVQIDYVDLPDNQREWTFTWPDVAPDLGYVNWIYNPDTRIIRERVDTNTWTVVSGAENITVFINTFTTPDNKMPHEHSWKLFDYGEFHYVASESSFGLVDFTPEKSGVIK